MKNLTNNILTFINNNQLPEQKHIIKKYLDSIDNAIANNDINTTYKLINNLKMYIITNENKDISFDLDNTDISICKSGFIKKYMNYAGGLCEAPDEFNQFLSLILLASTVGNKSYFHWGAAKLFPNLWFLLVAPSSSEKKTASFLPAMKILYNLDNEIIYPNEFSRESLLKRLSKQPTGVFFYSEYKSFVEVLNKQYVDAMGLFTDLFDPRSVPYKRELLNSEKTFEICDPAINLVTATPIEWLCDKLREEDIMGGFLLRFFIITAKPSNKFYNIPQQDNITLKQDIVEQLQKIKNISEPFSLTHRANELHKRWYIHFRKKYSGRFGSLANRIQTYSIKFAMLYEISDTFSAKISEMSVYKAITTVNYGINSFIDLFENEMTFSKEQKHFKKILNIIKEKKEISRSELYRKAKLPSYKLDNTIKTLLTSELIEVKVKKENNKKVVYYESIQ